MTTVGAGAPHEEGSSSRQWGLTTKLTVAALPLGVVALLATGAVVWSLLSSDSTPGFSLAETWAVVIGALTVLLVVGSLVAVNAMARSASRDIQKASRAARRIARQDLVDVLDALRSPDADLSRIRAPLLDTERSDEIGELGRSMGELHRSLIDVAARQIEALRVGVSNIFVTLARRNSSLVDRQLALLDTLEAREESPSILGGYYQLDHLATRMRRNAESLLVLAGSESPRMWVEATEMSDVVRAAVGEVDEYQRIEVVALEPAKLSGGAVSDLSHLLAELLENAVQFSPPSEPVRVTGLIGTGGYQLTVSDRGVGMTETRIAQLNAILARPPSLGLTVEPTMGMYVIAKLAHRHGVTVELARSVPGLSARITVPADHVQTMETDEPRYWEERAGRPYTSRAASRPSAADYSDAATREYILQRASTADRVIDLTKEAVLDADHAGGEAGPLPVRPTAAALVEEESGPAAAAPAETALGIRAALAAFDEGRRAADDQSGDIERDGEDS